MQHEKCATVAVGSGSRVPCPDNSRLSRHAPRPCYATCPRCTWCTLHLPLPFASFAKIQLILSANLLALFARQKVGAAPAAKFIRLKFAGNYLSKLKMHSLVRGISRRYRSIVVYANKENVLST